MNTQSSGSVSLAWTSLPRALPYGMAVRLEGGDGMLDVVSGRLWLTQANELADRFFGAGESVDIAAAPGAVIEALDRAQPTLVAWRRRNPRERWQRRIATLRRAARLVLHNAARAAFEATRDPGDAAHGSDTRIRQRAAAQEAGGCAAGAA